MKSRMTTGYARVQSGVRFGPTAEQIRRNCAANVSQMRCPHHQQEAWVEIEDEEFDASQVDIIACCEEFEQRIRKSLMDILRDRKARPY